MRLGRSIVWGIVLALVTVAVAVLAVVVARPGGALSMYRPGERVMVVVASHVGSDTVQLAQLVGVADLSARPERVTLVDPETTVTVPGTSYDQLRDAYAFGGGAGVSRALARSTGTDPLPVVAVSEQALLTIVERMGGVTVDVPFDATVFDGSTLFSFKAGRQSLDGPQVVALLGSADYAPDPVSVRSAVAEGLVSSLAAKPPALTDLVKAKGITSSLRLPDLRSVAAAAERDASGAVVETGAR